MKALAASLLLLVLLAACGRAPDPAPAVVAATVIAPASEAEAETEAEEPEWDPALGRGFTPGRNIGAVGAETAEKELAALYGAGNVKRAPWHLGEGETRPATVLFKGTPDEFWLLWKDDKYQLPERAFIVGNAWRSDDGLRIGLDLRTLVKINGGDFDFLGFGWDYGGGVTSWRTGRLSRYAGKLSVVLERADQASEDAATGDVSLASNAPGLDRLGISVRRIDIAL